MKKSSNLPKIIIIAVIIGICICALCLTLVIVACLVYFGIQNHRDAEEIQTSDITAQWSEPIASESATSEPEEITAATEETQDQPYLSDEGLYHCFWDASVQTSQFFEFFSDGTGRVINLVGMLSSKGVESEFTYEFSDGSMTIAWGNGRTFQWHYSIEEHCFTSDVVEFDGSIYHQKIERVSLFDLYCRWAQQLNTDIAYSSEYEWHSQMKLSQGYSEAYKAWDVLLNDVYSRLMELLPENEFSKLTSEQLQWIEEKELEMESAYSAFEGGSAAPMFRAMVGCSYTEQRIYELLQLLPEGFDREAHSAKIASIRERFYAAEATRGQMNTTFFGTSATAYYLDGKLQILEEASEVSQSETPTKYSDDYFKNCTKAWYYDDGEVYFIFMVNEENGDEYRLYFDNGKLIRWVAPNGAIYDLLYRWDEMQSYYDHALSQCEFAKDREIR